jgi:ABC-type dipeptide/oligopeptide/nickel transport system permease subunit
MGPYFFQDAYNNNLSYFRKAGAVCGSPANFATLLPSRAAEAAAAATLHPNPAADAATLTLAAPTRPGTVLSLTDALGRRLWSHEVAPSQTSLPIALSGQPAGLYLVHLTVPGSAPLTWKVQH